MDNNSRSDRPARSSASTPPPAGQAASGQQSFLATPPSIELPQGGGAVRGIGEKSTANPVTGTGSMSVPIAISPGRGGFNEGFVP